MKNTDFTNTNMLVPFETKKFYILQVIEKISLENEQRRKRKDNTKEVSSIDFPYLRSYKTDKLKNFYYSIFLKF